MSEYDIEELNAEFAGFRAGVPRIVSPGMDAARHTVRRRRRVRTAALSVLALLIAAPVTAYAAFGPDRDGPPAVVATAPGTPSPSVAEPSPSPFPSPSPSAPPPPSPSTPPSKQNVARYTLGPKGYGPLRLDMTAAQARASGMTTAIPATADCNAEVYLRGTRYAQERGYFPGRVWFADGGVAVIWATPEMSTPEGIRIGSSVAELRRAYPEWETISGEKDGRGGARVRGNSDAGYRIEVRDGKVVSIALNSAHRGCYE